MYNNTFIISTLLGFLNNFYATPFFYWQLLAILLLKLFKFKDLTSFFLYSSYKCYILAILIKYFIGATFIYTKHILENYYIIIRVNVYIKK